MKFVYEIHFFDKIKLQAYGTTMSEGRQLVKALEQQAQLMKIDNREAVLFIERLIGDIGKFRLKIKQNTSKILVLLLVN